MSSKFIVRSTGLFVLTVLILALIGMERLRDQTVPDLKQAATVPSSPVAASVAARDHSVRQPGTGSKEKPTAGRPFDALLAGSEILSQTTRPTASGHRVTTIYRTGFKYPLVRVDDDYTHTDSGSSPSRSVAMVADHLLVRLDETLQPELDKLLAQHPELSIRHHLDTGEHVLVSFPDAASPAAMDTWIDTLREHGLLSAEPDYLQSIARVPDDTSYSSLWGLKNTGQTGGTAGVDIDAQEAWDITTGSNSVIVGIIDSGMDYTHVDLAPNVWTNAAGQHGYDYYENDSDPINNTSPSHGTHVAGTIGAAGNNGQGVTGVSWNVKMMALRFIGPAGTGATSDAISCIRFATDNGAKILNNSWGGSGGNPGDNLETEINRARTQGVLFIAAAANGGPDQIGDDNDQLPNYPSNYTLDNIISVAATDASDQLAWFSNYGKNSVDLAAPGVNIYSTQPGNSYGTMNGTSMAAPHVTGVAALILAANNTLTYSQIRDHILNHTDAVPALNQRMTTGGRLNAFKAIQDLGGPVLSLTRKSTTIIGGNSDTYPNPGESVALNLTLANIGAKIANGTTITASLSPGAPATLNQTQVSGGNLAANGTKAFDPAFTLTLKQPAGLPATFTVTFTLSTPSSTTTWTDSIPITIWSAATLSGTVTRASTDTPIPGATIAIRGPVNHDLITDAGGHYQISTVAGTFAVTASSPGLVSSAPVTVNAAATTTSVNFSLGTATLELTPAVSNLTVPVDQIQAQNLNVRNNGDSPRDLAFDVKISGTGLASNVLYGIRRNPSGTTDLVQFDCSTGSQLGTQTLPDLSAYGPIYDLAHFNQKLWFLTSLYQGGNSFVDQVIPYDPATNTLGAPILLATAGNWPVKLFATDQDLLLSTSSNLGQPSLSKLNPTTGTLTPLSALPAYSNGNLCWSAARKSVFTVNYDSSIQEYLYPAFSSVRNWPLPAGTNYSSMIFSDAADALFVAGYQFSGGSVVNVLQKLNPTTGAPIAGFNAPQGISLITAPTGGGSNWLTTTLPTSAVSQGASRAIPFTINTSGMKTGDKFTATITLTAPLATTPVTATVNLTVGTPAADPGSWSDWFYQYFHRQPTVIDATADPDGDGSVNLLEYALGTDPTRHTRNPVDCDFETIAGKRYLRLTVNKNPNATGLNLAVQVASTLGDASSWTTDGTVTEVNTRTVLRVRDMAPVGFHSLRFIRLKVSQP